MKLTSLSWRAALCAAWALLAACAGPSKPEPERLESVVPLVGVQQVWKARLDSIEFPLQLAVHGTVLVAATSEGEVAAVDVQSGHDVWRLDLDTDLSAGVGFDGRYASVVSTENELITVQQGRILWRKKLDALTITAPLVAGDRVFVLSADRSVVAFDAASGHKLWTQQRTADPLVLGQASVLMAVEDTLVVGQGGRIAGLNPSNGMVRWAVTLANSRGVNEVERLVDVVAGVARVENQICARAFQSAVGCFDAQKGQLVWTKPASGFAGVHGDAALLLGTEQDGRVVAWNRQTGDVMWRFDRLRYRQLSAPLLVGRTVVVGDNDGNVHFLSRENGSFVNRLPTDGSPMATAPVVVGNTVVVVTRRGGIFGFRPE